MLDELVQLLDKAASWPVIIGLAALTLILLVGLGLAQLRLKKYSGGPGWLDFPHSHKPKEMYRVLETYGPEGRCFYLICSLTLDTLLPVSYALLLILFLFWEAKQASTPQEAAIIRLAALTPFLGMVADYLENRCIAIMLGCFPKEKPFLERAQPPLMFAKWALIVVAIVLSFIFALSLWMG